MVMLQVVQVNKLFENIDRLRSSQWQEVCPESSNKLCEPKKRRPKVPKQVQKTTGRDLPLACDTSLSNSKSVPGQKKVLIKAKLSPNFERISSSSPVITATKKKPKASSRYLQKNNQLAVNVTLLSQNCKEKQVKVTDVNEAMNSSTFRLKRDNTTIINKPIISSLNPQVQQPTQKVNYSEDVEPNDLIFKINKNATENVQAALMKCKDNFFYDLMRKPKFNETETGISKQDSSDSGNTVNFDKESENSLYPEDVISELNFNLAKEPESLQVSQEFIPLNVINNHNFAVEYYFADNFNYFSTNFADPLEVPVKNSFPLHGSVSLIAIDKNTDKKRIDFKTLLHKENLQSRYSVTKVNIFHDFDISINEINIWNAFKKGYSVKFPAFINFVNLNKPLCYLTLYLYASGILSLLMMLLHLNPYNCCLLANQTINNNFLN